MICHRNLFCRRHSLGLQLLPTQVNYRVFFCFGGSVPGRGSCRAVVGGNKSTPPLIVRTLRDGFASPDENSASSMVYTTRQSPTRTRHVIVAFHLLAARRPGIRGSIFGADDAGINYPESSEFLLRT